MKINGYEVTIDRIPEGQTAAGQWRSQINGKTVAVSKSRRAVMSNADFLAARLSPEAFRALVSPMS
jgi:hypothetical protein